VNLLEGQELRFGVIANLNRVGAEEIIKRLLTWAGRNSVEVVLCEEMTGVSTDGYPVVPRDSLPAESDVILSMGGDGTLLATARLIGDSGLPIVGINIGSLGFLTEHRPDELEEILDRILDQDFIIQERMVIETEILDGENSHNCFALNDAVIGRSDTRMIHMALYSNNDYICSYAADGLIIATPTGSTAYSLAVGGPILNPEMDALIASPIAPHTLASRPLIFNSDEVLTLQIESDTDAALLTVDGQVSFPLGTNSRVSFRKGGYYVQLVRFRESSFYRVLRSKLHWGVLPIQQNIPEDK